MNVIVHPADVQDRDGAFLLLRRARRLFPFIKRIFADGGYAGEKMALVVWRTGAWKLEIVKRADVSGFEVLPKRWIVERTFAWISRNRRLARDFERYAMTVAAFVRLAMIRIMLRRLTATDVAPNFYPVGTGVWRVMPCWAVMAAVRGAEPSGERSAADRRAAAYLIGVIQPSRE